MVKTIISAITAWAKGYFKQADWNEEDKKSTGYIRNKPELPKFFDGEEERYIPKDEIDSYIPRQVQANWNETNEESTSFIQNKPDIVLESTLFNPETHTYSYKNNDVYNSYLRQIYEGDAYIFNNYSNPQNDMFVVVTGDIGFSYFNKALVEFRDWEFSNSILGHSHGLCYEYKRNSLIWLLLWDDGDSYYLELHFIYDDGEYAWESDISEYDIDVSFISKTRFDPIIKVDALPRNDIQADWNETNKLNISYIKNKPSILIEEDLLVDQYTTLCYTNLIPANVSNGDRIKLEGRMINYDATEVIRAWGNKGIELNRGNFDDDTGYWVSNDSTTPFYIIETYRDFGASAETYLVITNATDFAEWYGSSQWSECIFEIQEKKIVDKYIRRDELTPLKETLAKFEDEQSELKEDLNDLKGQIGQGGTITASEGLKTILQRIQTEIKACIRDDSVCPNSYIDTTDSLINSIEIGNGGNEGGGDEEPDEPNPPIEEPDDPVTPDTGWTYDPSKWVSGWTLDNYGQKPVANNGAYARVYGYDTDDYYIPIPEGSTKVIFSTNSGVNFNGQMYEFLDDKSYYQRSTATGKTEHTFVFKGGATSKYIALGINYASGTVPNESLQITFE